ncbi:uncharacterized protein [Chelonus insularis]|uniref:uncharacterized protein isoform X1 n=1 Tax=Chelonus insularis TaxID=460826 RepID=UPI00158B7283|nr:uncharacterized protein LOC118068096 isoform X1 [Chelonus insularis]
MAIYWILIFYYYINCQVLLVTSGNYDESSLEDTQNNNDEGSDIQQSGLSSNEQEDKDNTIMEPFSSEEKKSGDLTELKEPEINHGQIQNSHDAQLSHNQFKMHALTHNKHEENPKTSSNKRVNNETHQSSVNVHAIHSSNQQDIYRRRNNLPTSKKHNFNTNFNQNIMDARVEEKKRYQDMRYIADQTEKKGETWNKILPYLPPRFKTNELNDDKNITQIAHTFAKHIVGTLPLDLRNNKLAYDLAVKMIYERLKMHNDAEFLEHDPYNNSRFNQSSNSSNRVNNCCCCDDENSAVIMKISKEESYKCKPIINTAPSDGYILLENIGWFKIHTIPKTWNQARKQCITEGAHLAFMESSEEIEWLLTTTLNLPEDIFIGVHNMFDQNEWISVLDTPIEETGYIKWSGNKQIDSKKAHCGVLVKKTRQIIHEMCDNAHVFVCKISI